MTEELIKALIDIRYECGLSECEGCCYADEYHNCYFAGLPYEWYSLEKLLKKGEFNKAEIEYLKEDEELLTRK